ncbi:MAG: 16S rRNA (adenine(1518)-N(6)/adenine(1519)-N(6))-dimethyltransferase RsmA, partial [Pyrinomonadaceae bacterium]
FAKKSFGQNFLVDEAYIEQIIAELNPLRGETIIEIGAGRGALTRHLVESGANILAIELDRHLMPILRNEFSQHENLTLIEADALNIDFSQILSEESKTQNPKPKIVANLPYNISTAILQKLIQQRKCFSELILMLQREVVTRITAEAGSSERGYLSVLVEAYADSEKLFDVPPTAFRPIPKVWSSVVRLQIKETSLITDGAGNEELFWQIVSLGFAQKRKTIFNNLKNAVPDLLEKFAEKGGVGVILQNADVESIRRAETLTLPEWKRIFDSL